MKAKKSLEERFWDKVIPEPNSGCWLWTGALSGGYGRIGVGSRTDGTRKSDLATRVSWRLFRGEVPSHLDALHKCDNKCCVNPDHLYIGTHSQNMRDAYQRGQKKPANGKRPHSVHLSDDDVRFIRISSVKTKELVARFGASKSHLIAIRAGRARTGVI